MKLSKVFAKNDFEFITSNASFIEVTAHLGEGMYDPEDSTTWDYIDSIIVRQGKESIDITWIVKNNFPKFETDLLELDWESELNEN